MISQIEMMLRWVSQDDAVQVGAGEQQWWKLSLKDEEKMIWSEAKMVALNMAGRCTENHF